MFLTTTGLEYEIVTIGKSDMNNLLREAGVGNMCDIVHDASIEIPVGRYRNALTLNSTVPSSKLFNLSTSTSGAEIVTYPLLPREMHRFIFSSMKAIKSSGVFSVSPRAAIHFHIGYALSLDTLKKSLAMGIAVDPLLFGIAGMGNEYRGNVNHSVYARSLEAGVTVRTHNRDTDDYQYVLLSPEDALRADSIDQFLQVFFTNRNGNRYHPARYFATNVYSLLLKGTLEFRHFNQCEVPKYIYGVGMLCRAITTLTNAMSLKEINKMRKYSIRESSKETSKAIFDSLIEQFKRYGVEFAEFDSIIEIIKETPEFTFTEEHAPLTHSKAEIIYRDWMRKVNYDVERSGYIDIHNVESISTLDERY